MKRKVKYLKGAEVTGDAIAEAIQVLLDQHAGMHNSFAVLEWKPEGALIEMHFEHAVELGI